MFILEKIFASAILATFVNQITAESTLHGIITGYGSASNDPAGSSTICCGEEGSEHSATYDDPGVCASDNSKYPVGTKIYVPVCFLTAFPPSFPFSSTVSVS